MRITKLWRTNQLALVGVLSATDADTDDLLRYELATEKGIQEIIGLY